jgi:hypothetical protein
MIHTRARSKSYPYIDKEALAYLIEEMGLPVFRTKDLEQLMLESMPLVGENKSQPPGTVPKLLRPGFIEALCRIAQIKYKVYRPGKIY